MVKEIRPPKLYRILSKFVDPAKEVQYNVLGNQVITNIVVGAETPGHALDVLDMPTGKGLTIVEYPYNQVLHVGHEITGRVMIKDARQGDL